MYGIIRNEESRNEYTHRVSFRLYRGPIPNGICVCHHCDNPRCANPDHLFLGTHADNARDRNRKGRARGGAPKGNRNAQRLTPTQEVAIIEMADSAPIAKVLAKHGISKSTLYRLKSKHSSAVV